MNEPVLYESRMRFRPPGCTTVPFFILTGACAAAFALCIRNRQEDLELYLTAFFAVLLPEILLVINYLAGCSIYRDRAFQLLKDRIRIINTKTQVVHDTIMLGEIQAVVPYNAHSLLIQMSAGTQKINGLSDAHAAADTVQSYIRQSRAAYLRHLAATAAVQEQSQNKFRAADQLILTGQITQEQYDNMQGRSEPQHAPLPSADTVDMQNAADFMRRNEMIAQQMLAENEAADTIQEEKTDGTGSAV